MSINRVPPSTTEKTIRSRQLLTKSTTDEQSSSVLRGRKSQLTIYEPLEELNDEIRAARQYVQNIKDESHSKQRKRQAEIKENNTLNRQTSRHHTVDDRLLRTIHGSMAFGCLVAIDKAYSDRGKIEQRKLVAQDVEQTRQEHSFNIAQIQVRNQISIM
jgi:phosphomevalonate kinase